MRLPLSDVFFMQFAIGSFYRLQTITKITEKKTKITDMYYTKEIENLLADSFLRQKENILLTGHNIKSLVLYANEDVY